MTSMEKVAMGFVLVGLGATLLCIAVGCPWCALTCALSAGYIAWTAGDDDEDEDEIEEEDEEELCV